MPWTHSKNFPGKKLFANIHVRKKLFAYNGSLKKLHASSQNWYPPVNIKWFFPKSIKTRSHYEKIPSDLDLQDASEPRFGHSDVVLDLFTETSFSCI